MTKSLEPDAIFEDKTAALIDAMARRQAYAFYHQDPESLRPSRGACDFGEGWDTDLDPVNDVIEIALPAQNCDDE